MAADYTFEFDDNSDSVFGKLIKKAKQAGASVNDAFGNVASKAQEKFQRSVKDSNDALQSQEQITARAAKSAEELVKAYFGLEKFNQSMSGTKSGEFLGGGSIDKLIKEAEALKAEGVVPGFSKEGIEIVDKRSVENAKLVKNELNQVEESTDQTEKNVRKTNETFRQISDDAAPRLRYAMYDISNSARRISLALGALAIGPIAAAIQYEKDFANVVRTTGVVDEEVNKLKQDLIEIAQLTPIPWADITNIATLAGQLGIAQTSVADFTETVAKFSATTDLTVDAAATAFGRLDQLIDGVNGRFNNLGSAILAVGVDSVATESQIVNVSTQIASLGNLAGLSAADVIGLSGALASLGIRPELARGTVTRLFSNIGAAVAQGGRSLEEYGRLTDQTAQEFADAWSSEPTEVLLNFFEGIQREGSAAESTLRDIGITSVRDIPAILRLAQSQDEVRRLIALSNDEFEYGLAVNEQYGIISQTVAAQLERLTQNIQTMFATMGEGTLGPLNGLIAGINGLVQGFTALAKTPFGGPLVQAAGVIVAIGATLAGLASILATVLAGFLAYRLALKEMGVASGGAAIKNLLLGGSFKAVETGAKSATFAMRAFRISMLAAFVGIPLLVGVIAQLYSAFNKASDSAEEAGKRAEEYFGDTGAFLESVRQDTKDFNKAVSENFAGDLGKAIEAGFKGDAIDVQTVAIQQNTDAARDLIKTTAAVVDGQKQVEEATRGATGALDEQAIAYGENAEEFLRGAFIQDVNIQNFAQDPAIVQAFRDAGGDFQQLLQASLSGEGVDYLLGVKEVLKQQALDLGQQLDFAIATGEDQAAIDALNQQYLLTLSTIQSLEDNLIPAAEAVDDLRVATEAALASEQLFTEGLGEMAEYSKLTADQIGLIIERIFGFENRLESAEKAARDFGNELRETEGAGDGLRGNIEELIGSILNLDTSPTQQIANLAALLAFMKANALGTPELLGAIEDAIYEIGAVAAEQNPEIAEFIALMLASGGAGVADISSIFGAIQEGIDGVGSSADGAAEKVKTLAERFDELLDSIFGPVNAAQKAAQSIADLGESYANLGTNAFYASGEIQDAVSSITESASSPEEAISNLNALFNRLASVAGGATAPSLQFLRSVIDQLAAEFGVASNAIAQATIDLSFFDDGVKQVQKEVRTLIDYAGDIDKVISRAFDIRFADILQIDKIADSWQKLSEQVQEAKDTIDELKKSQQDLAADRAIKQYFLSVAESYGDMLRAAQLRQELANIDREQAENAAQLAEAQAIAGGDLSGTGEESRRSRAALLGLVQEYQDYITVLAESGASQEELRAATARARQEFIEQAVELGYQEEVVLEYAQAFDDVTTAINNVPRNITVDANVNPALQALNELNAKLQDSINLAGKLNKLTNQGSTDTTPPPPTVPEPVIRKRVIDMTREERRAIGLPYYSGGYTGPGGKYEPAGIVHKGEYVVPKQYVNQSSGLPNAQFLAQLQNGMRGYANGGFVGGMGGGEAMMVELSPYDRKLLADAGNVQLRLNGRVVAEATNASNYNEARRGSN